jgi:hypothetical protein
MWASEHGNRERRIVSRLCCNPLGIGPYFATAFYIPPRKAKYNVREPKPEMVSERFQGWSPRNNERLPTQSIVDTSKG